ncbi:DUF2852 domain-containing protein [Roseibium salinum]|uniref:DUF2852 domain-containing protein n=1 Tax=Roseibium salinum TaxID=1604349 RepID=A0ABT3R6T0_9HYPH|nr:DUF2852 domain-containing protein [Roseibium sp. DSM 29163]MCX2724760.1 DUF2852 domain-containing protein [Roseibium sp. DSM 29163]
MTTTKSCMIKPAWTPATIALMVLGFMVFWPLGLAMLAYILWGDRFEAMFRDARDQWRGSPLKGAFDQMSNSAGYARTGNAAFDDYRERELKRLEEERAKLDTMRAEFDDFLRELRRARDQEEFDRFMANRGRSAGGSDASTL